MADCDMHERLFMMGFKITNTEVGYVFNAGSGLDDLEVLYRKKSADGQMKEATLLICTSPRRTRRSPSTQVNIWQRDSHYSLSANPTTHPRPRFPGGRRMVGTVRHSHTC